MPAVAEPTGARVTSSLVLDTANFFSVLTGSSFYTNIHSAEFDEWSAKLGLDVMSQVADAAAAYGSNMLGPRLALIISAVPDFDAFSVSSLFSQPELIERHFRETVYYKAEDWPKTAELCRRLAPAAEALEVAGFPAFWRERRLPIIGQAIAEYNQTAGSFEIWTAVQGTLGWNIRDQGLDLYVCSFAAPHGMRITGAAYISDARYPVPTVLRIAIHEAFHPPLHGQEADTELRTLAADPMLVQSHRELGPEYGYRTVDSFLEENIVEAMEIAVSSRIGLLDDPVDYLLKHDEGSHTLSMVLVDAFRTHPRAEGESFADYFKRVVGSLPVGELRKEYDRIVGKSGASPVGEQPV